MTEDAIGFAVVRPNRYGPALRCRCGSRESARMVGRREGRY